MYDFSIIRLSDNSIHCTIFNVSTHRTVFSKTFHYEPSAEFWANTTIEGLERKAQAFHDDPITRHYGL
jgi:hypothetical protein